jgi:hypothetical protein
MVYLLQPKKIDLAAGGCSMNKMYQYYFMHFFLIKNILYTNSIHWLVSFSVACLLSVVNCCRSLPHIVHSGPILQHLEACFFPCTFLFFF